MRHPKAEADMYDLIIRDVMLIDGSGSPAMPADVAVSDGKISEIGRISAAARETMDAGGLALAPGIVDIHTHYDAQLTWEARCSPSPSPSTLSRTPSST